MRPALRPVPQPLHAPTVRVDAGGGMLLAPVWMSYGCLEFAFQRALDGLVLSSDGSIPIALWDGSMLCLR